MDPITKAIPKLRRDRTAGWQYIAALVPDAKLQSSISAHIKDIKRLEKQTGSSGVSRTHSRPGKRFKSSSRTIRLCKHCKTPLPHKGEDLRSHLYRIRRSWVAKQSWINYPPGSPQRRLRMEKVWAGRRKKKNQDIISTTHQRIVKLFGTERAIQFGRARTT